MKVFKNNRATSKLDAKQVDTETKTELNTNTLEKSAVNEKQSKGLSVFNDKMNKITKLSKDKKESKLSRNESDKEEKSIKQRVNLSMTKSLGMKISTIFIICLILCVAIVGFSSYNLSKKTLEDNIKSASQETITQVSRNINTLLSKFENLSLQLVLDETLITNLRDFFTEDTVTQIQGYNEVRNILQTFSYTNKEVQSITLIPINNKYSSVYFGTGSTNNNASVDQKSYQDEPWFQQVIDKKGTVLWVEPKGGDTISLARLGTNVGKGFEYIILMDFNTSDIFSAANEVEIIDNSYLEIINKDNLYVKTENIENVGLEANFAMIENLIDPARGFFMDSHKGTGDKYIIVYSQIQANKDWYLIGALPEAEIKSEINPIFVFTSVMILIAAALAIVVAFFMLRMISRPLTQMSTVMTKGAKGDLTVRAPKMKRQDEIGVLANTFDDMMIQIEELARQTTNSAQQVLTTAADLTQASHKTAIAGKEISIATDEIAAGASALAIEAEKGSDLTQHISSQMSEVNQTREQMNQSANQVDEASEQGLNYMTGLIERTGETELMVKQMVEKVNALSDSTKSIVKILDVLNSITKQTNILSLNATIEAARAGQAGKGFMVVADEIRQLAEQSRQSIDVVGQITETISKEIVETVKVLKQAQPIFQEQIVSVKEANEIFVTVRSQMDSLKQNIDNVSSAFDQLSETQDTLGQSMNNVSAVAEQSSATSQEVASLSNEQLVISEQLVSLSTQLESVSNNLKSQLSRFTISNE